MLNISITVFGKDNICDIEASYVRKLDGSEINTKDIDSIKEYVDYFLCSESLDNFSTKAYSPFGKFAVFVYKSHYVENTILVTWEHFQS